MTTNLILKYVKVFSLIAGLSGIITILFYLITGWGSAIYFLEPNPYIRITEIIIGLLSLPFLFIMIIDNLKGENGGKRTWKK